MRKIRAYKKYFEDFMSSLSVSERDKVTRALALFKTEDKIPSHYIKFLKDEIYEFRVTCANTEIRLLFIYDGKDIVILFNCFKKKTQKTPNSEINKALKLKKEYYETKRDTP